MDSIDTTLDNEIARRDFDGIRDTLCTYIAGDLSFRTGVLEEKIAYCLARGIRESDLFAEFSGDALDENPQNWDKAYVALLRTKLRSNFSRRRLEHLKKAAQKAYPAPSASAAQSDPGTGETKNPAPAAKPGPSPRAANKTGLYVAAAVVVAVAAAVILWLAA